MSETTTSPCAHCGGQVPSTVTFCPHCGKPAISGDGSDDGERETLTDASTASAAPAESEPQPGEVEEAGEAIVPAESGLHLDWDPELVDLVTEAAALRNVSLDGFIRDLVEGEARKIVKKRRGMLSLDEATDLLGVPKREVVQKINAGELIARKIDGEWMIDRDGLGEVEKKAGDMTAQLELDLRELARSAGLMGVDFDALADSSASATLCYVNQDGVLVCPREAWRKMGRKQVFAEAKDAVRRYLRRRDRELGRI